MIIGDPYKFAFWIDIVPEWNDDDSTWINGIFSLCINGKIYPCVATSTLNSEVPILLDGWYRYSMPCENEALFQASKMNAVKNLLEITFPANGSEDYRYKLSTPTIEDNDVYSFVLAHNDEVRILVVTASYDNNSLEIYETKIDEITIRKSEMRSMISELDSYYQRMISNKQQTAE